jgi:hypothetical protein
VEQHNQNYGNSAQPIKKNDAIFPLVFRNSAKRYFHFLKRPYLINEKKFAAQPINGGNFI